MTSDGSLAGRLEEALRAAGCVYAEEEAALLLEAAGSPDDARRLVQERVAGRPLEHVLGWVAFAGLRVTVSPGVFVPRARSALLVDLAAHGLRPGAVAVDLCCGSGALACALTARLGGVEVHATDVDPVAVACARLNLPPHRVHQGDLYDALPPGLAGRVDVLVVNAPYVPDGELDLMPREARLHEPVVALAGGSDGLDLHRRVALGAPDWLALGGRLVLETSRSQAAATMALVEGAGLEATVVTDDDLDATAIVGVA